LRVPFLRRAPCPWPARLHLYPDRLGLPDQLLGRPDTIDIGDWVGLDNYRAMLTNSEFLRSLRTILIFAIFIVPTTFFFALGLAVLVNSVGFGRAFFRSAFFIPTAVSYVVASIVWKMGIFNGLPYGFANM